MKLEVGMYVRTNIGEIAKIINSKHYENDTGNYNELITDIRIEKFIYDDKVIPIRDLFKNPKENKNEWCNKVFNI